MNILCNPSHKLRILVWVKQLWPCVNTELKISTRFDNKIEWEYFYLCNKISELEEQCRNVRTFVLYIKQMVIVLNLSRERKCENSIRSPTNRMLPSFKINNKMSQLGTQLLHSYRLWLPPIHQYFKEETKCFHWTCSPCNHTGTGVYSFHTMYRDWYFVCVLFILMMTENVTAAEKSTGTGIAATNTGSSGASSSSSSGASTLSSSSSAGAVTPSRCEEITIPMCRGIGYNLTSLPNELNHDTQEEAGLEVHQFWPLVEIHCSPDLKFFLCSMYAPICIEDYLKPLPACRSVCERARNGCVPIMKQYGFQWPERMACEKFPVNGDPNNLCMEQNNRTDSSPTTTARPTRKPTPGCKPGKKGCPESVVPPKNKECECRCRPPLITLGRDSEWFNRSVSVGKVQNCAFPCRGAFFTQEEKDFASVSNHLFIFKVLKRQGLHFGTLLSKIIRVSVWSTWELVINRIFGIYMGKFIDSYDI